MRSAAAFLAAGLDPVVLARQAGLQPDEWQQQALRSRSPRLLFNITRQGGKSITTALIGLHQALFVPNSLILLLSRSRRQSGELFGKLASSYRHLGRPVRAVAETALTLTLANGSRIVALPGTEATIRGYSGVALLCVDEAARVPDELYHSVRPMLAVSGGRIILLSTFFGRRGFFYEEWQRREEWDYYEVPATSCARIPASFLAEERRTLPAWFYEQEYECRPADTTDTIFTGEMIRSAVSTEVTPLFVGERDGAAAPSSVAG